MRIILRKTYGKGQKIFNSKSAMLDYIEDNILFKYNDDYDSDIRCMGLPRDFRKWSIKDLSDYFFADYKLI